MTERPVLLCVPHAGGTAASFRPWHAALGDVAEVIPLEIAGHGARRHEPLPRTLAAALRSIWPIVAGYAARQCVLFGHSLGALYAFELARRLAAARRPPSLLVVSGRNAPSWPSEVRGFHLLPDEDFVATLAGFGGIPSQIAQDPAMVSFFLPSLRADMCIADGYARADGDLLHCPVTVFAGARDPLVSPARTAAWRQETTASCELIMLQGGHFCRPGDYTGPLRARIIGCPRGPAPAARRLSPGA